jgi:hypothetical protein
MSARDSYGQAADWLVSTARRNPEALLVLAAGCALLMRGRSSDNTSWTRDEYSSRYYRDVEARGRSVGNGMSYDEAQAEARNIGRDMSDAAGRGAEAVRGYASQVTDRISGAAAPYAERMSGFAGQVRQSVADLPNQAMSRVQGGFAQVLREQPLALAVAGLAAGAAVAALFPASAVERRAFGPAHDAMADAANRAVDSVTTAASETGERLKQTAEERGLDPEGLKDLARDVAGEFADRVADKMSGSGSSVPPTEAGSLAPDQGEEHHRGSGQTAGAGNSTQNPGSRR